MDKIAIFLLGFFKKIINNSGADFEQVKLIVALKLQMDNRKTINPNNNNKQPNYTLLIQYGMYFFFGILMSAMIGGSNNSYTGLFVAYTFIIFMLIMNMIADFSTVLLDTRDNTIIIPRPVSEQTYLLSRIVHIAFYILGFALAFAIVPIIVIFFKYNALGALFFFFNVLLGAIFSLFFTNLFYLSLMKFTTGERFKDIIAYFQIFITIFFFGGYQVIIRLIDKTNLFSIDTSHWWIYLIPSAWMAGSNESFIYLDFTFYRIVSLILSWVVPLVGLWLVIKVLAPGYANKLVILEQGDIKVPKTNEKELKWTVAGVFASLLTRSSTEFSFFQLIWRIAGRDRKFKQSVYPVFGMIAVFVFIIIFNRKEPLSDLANSYSFLTTLYVPIFYLYLILKSLQFSDNYQSSWIYKVAPISTPGEILSASVKTISVKLFLPVYIIINGIFIYYRGFGFLVDIYIGFLLSVMAVVAMLSYTKLHLPFTTGYADRTAGASKLLQAIIPMFIAGIMAFFHFILCFYHIPLVYPAIIVTIACWYVFKYFRHINWNKINYFSV